MFKNITPKYQQWFGALASIVLMFLFLQPIFKDYFSRPNSMMYAFGGDALMLYYNTSYHTRYGEGPTLRSMNYPDGEYIYLTDAQGALSNTLQWINRYVVDISGQTVGIVNGLNLYLLFVAVLLVFFLLRALGARILTSVLFAPMIVLLSPQIWRMGGHFGLAYPFLIPMAMLWFLRKYRVGRLEKRDALVLAASVFFTFNNPYTGFNVNFFLLLSGLLLFVFQGFALKNWKRPAIISGMGLLALALVFLDFSLFDLVGDRLHPQWGFFVYHASFEGLFHPPHSILHDWLTKFHIMVSEVSFEAMLNVGIVATLALATMLVFSVVAFFSLRNKPSLQKLSLPHRVLLLASLVLFVLAANTSLIKISPEWLENHMGWLLMFKASGRLGWTLYFALTLTAVVFIDRLLALLPSWIWALLVSLGLVSLWNAEINQYTRPRFDNVFHPNFFDRQHEKEMLDVLKENQIDISQYQAVLALPKMVAWSDKIISDINFHTQFHSTRLSLATGLPMVNSMLSRIGLQHTLERVQMYSDPLVERSLLQKFPHQKDLLLLLGADALPQLQDGERFLIEVSEPLAQTKDFSLFRLRMADLADNPALRRAQEEFQNGAHTAPAAHLNFDSESNGPAFYGEGSHKTQPIEEKVLEFRSPFERDTQMVFSSWTYLDAGQWKSGFWLLSVRNESGQEIQNIQVETRKSNDVQGNWIRAKALVSLPRNAQLVVSAYADKAMLIDEVMLWPSGSSPIVDDPDSDTFLFENFKVKKRELPTRTPPAESLR